MASLLNRRTAPHVVINNHSQPSSISYSTRQSNQKELNKPESGIQTIVNTPHGNPRDTPRSFYSLTRAIQV